MIYNNLLFKNNIEYNKEIKIKDLQNSGNRNYGMYTR